MSTVAIRDRLEAIYTHKPLVLAHRGASYDAPQNTLAAFALARQMGADGVELDTSLTRDGVPVVFHDLMLDRTTNGTGPVRSLDLAAIKALDAGGKFLPRFKGEQIPTLDEALETIGPDLVVNIELKTSRWFTDGLERAVMDTLRRHNAMQRVIISSFNPLSLRLFRAIAPDIPVGYLFSPQEPFYLREGWLMVGLSYEAQHPYHAMIDSAYMAAQQSQGYRVNTWTVDDPERIIELRDLGVDAIITNRPDVALKLACRNMASTEGGTEY
ncbi:MAG: glycerophosphodiester phosphodiesterase family protein, partial [Chloroflexota bacterium]